MRDQFARAGGVVCDMPPRLAYTVNEFCDVMRISRSHFYDLVKEQKIKTVSLGGRKLVPATEATRILEQSAA